MFLKNLKFCINKVVVKKLSFTLVIFLFLLSPVFATFPIKTPSNTKLLLIGFMNTDCSYCAESLLWLNNINNQYKDKGLEVVVANFASISQNTKQLIAKNKYSFTTYNGNNKKLALKLQVVIAPTILLINSQNKVVIYQRGSSEKSLISVKKRIDTFFKNSK